MSVTDKWEEKEKAELIELLREQMKIEGRLVGLYENSAKELTSTPVRARRLITDYLNGPLPDSCASPGKSANRGFN